MKREAEKVEHTTHRQAAAPVCELGSNPNNMAALSSRACGRFLDSDKIRYPENGGFKLVELSPNIQHVVGGSANNLIVAKKDGIVILDAPVDDALGHRRGQSQVSGHFAGRAGEAIKAGEDRGCEGCDVAQGRHGRDQPLQHPKSRMPTACLVGPNMVWVTGPDFAARPDQPLAEHDGGW